MENATNGNEPHLKWNIRITDGKKREKEEMKRICLSVAVCVCVCAGWRGCVCGCSVKIDRMAIVNRDGKIFMDGNEFCTDEPVYAPMPMLRSHCLAPSPPDCHSSSFSLSLYYLIIKYVILNEFRWTDQVGREKEEAVVRVIVMAGGHI